VVAALASQGERVLITLHTRAASSRPCGRTVEPIGVRGGLGRSSHGQ
jgi:hypothetical protein